MYACEKSIISSTIKQLILILIQFSVRLLLNYNSNKTRKIYGN